MARHPFTIGLDVAGNRMMLSTEDTPAAWSQAADPTAPMRLLSSLGEPDAGPAPAEGWAQGWALTPDQALALAKDLGDQAVILKRRHAVHVMRQRSGATPDNSPGQMPAP